MKKVKGTEIDGRAVAMDFAQPRTPGGGDRGGGGRGGRGGSRGRGFGRGKMY